MTDYRSTKGKFEYSERLDAIYSDVVKRMRTNRFREDTLTGTPPDGKEPFIDVFLETRGEPFPTRIAKAIVRSWMVSEIPIYEGDLLIGCQRPERIVREHFSFGIQEHRHMFDWCDIYKNRREELEPILDELHSEFVPLDWDHLGNEADKIFTPVEGRDIYHEVVEPGLWWVGGFQGHTVPNYQILMDKGIGGVHVRVCERLSEETDQKKIEMLTACKIILEGLRDWILMQADAAEKKAAEGGKWADSLIKIAENCRAIALDAPKTYYQACQLCWFYSLWDWVDCVGRIDQFMYPFFQKALEEDRQFCEDCTAALMLKFLEHGIHNMTIGGCDPKTGEDVTNELSFLYLQIARRNHETHPRISLRIGENTDPALLALGVQMWSEGMSDPTVASDTTIIPAFIKNYGVEPEDARNYTLLGCQELEIPGKSNFGCEDGMLNLGKILEITMNDGYTRFDSTYRVGLPTGHITDYDTFEDFYSAYNNQMKFFTKHFVNLCNKGQEMRAANYAKLVKTPFTEDCIERGLNLDDGGAVYNYGCVETAGSSVVADSLTAVKKLVFDEKKISKETLETAIAANFKGYEDVRQMLIKDAPKFGNDNDEADGMARRVLCDFWSEIKKYKSVRGGEFSGACSLLSSGMYMGGATWATPDGRYHGMPFGNSIGPVPGRDKLGLTAMLSSVSKLPLDLGVGGTTCNVLIPADHMNSEDTKGKIAALMNAFLQNGGQLAQITTASLEDMKDAKVHPEDHGDLIVRVGGFSINFIELDSLQQDEIISRYA
ncbi:MAG: hypothetical protein E7575_05560 [Ruminococcaceae bacterium]|nr:hypothetical protein [Oscillospiraceae bacterium]